MVDDEPRMNDGREMVTNQDGIRQKTLENVQPGIRDGQRVGHVGIVEHGVRWTDSRRADECLKDHAHVNYPML